MKFLNNLQELSFELDEIESIEELGYCECVDIEVEKDHSFSLSNGLISHNSARGNISQSIGRDGFSYYAGRGVGINGYDSSIQKLIKNEEFTDIMNILELDPFGKEEIKTISYDKIVIACDADMDAIFITSQYIGWFMRFAPNLFKERKIARLITPLVLLKKGNKVLHRFFTLDEFKSFESKNDLSSFKVEYLKGLGSWEKEEFTKLFEEGGFEAYLQDLILDDEAEKMVDDWLNGKSAERRKEYLRNYNLNIELL